MEELSLNIQNIPSIRRIFDKLECTHATSETLIRNTIARTEGRFHGSGVQSLDDTSLIAIGITSKSFSKLKNTCSWDDILQNLMNNPALEPTETKVRHHHGHYKTNPSNWVGTDGKLNSKGITEVQVWIKSFIPQQILFEESEISERLCKQVLLKTIENFGTYQSENSQFSIFKSFWRVMGYDKETNPSDRYRVNSDDTSERAASKFSRDFQHGPPIENDGNPIHTRPADVYKEKPILEWTVLRFPDDDNNTFAVYHLKLSAWTNLTHDSGMFKTDKLQVGTIGEYSYQKFRPRVSFINEISEATREKAVQEATRVLEFHQK